MTTDQTGTSYTGAKIQVLKGLEAVRHRPAYCKSLIYPIIRYGKNNTKNI